MKICWVSCKWSCKPDPTGDSFFHTSDSEVPDAGGTQAGRHHRSEPVCILSDLGPDLTFPDWVLVSDFHEFSMSLQIRQMYLYHPVQPILLSLGIYTRILPGTRDDGQDCQVGDADASWTEPGGEI